MHTSLAEIFEALPQGLLWTARDGTVRFANALATTRTGLIVGRKLWDPTLIQAVAAVLKSGAAQAVEATGVAASGAASPLLKCRVTPGLTANDVFIHVAGEGSGENAVMDNLMQVIDSDLRTPVRQTQAQLQALSRSGTEPQFKPTLDALEQLTQALDTLVDLAQVWRGGTLAIDERIELWPLIEKVWQDVEPLAHARNVTVRFRSSLAPDALAPLYGNTAWLRRIMRECLEAAVRSSRPRSTLHIEHHQNGPHAMVIFRDCGVFAPVKADAIDMPRHSASTRANPSRLAARDQLGLQLCRHVLALHGGQLREENEDGLRNFLLELPTGAPFRATPPTIDAAQIQQYARDLSELMARSRDRSAQARNRTNTPTPMTGVAG